MGNLIPRRSTIPVLSNGAKNAGLSRINYSRRTKRGTDSGSHTNATCDAGALWHVTKMVTDGLCRVAEVSRQQERYQIHTKVEILKINS